MRSQRIRTLEQYVVVLYGCKLDLVTVQGTLTKEKFRTDILNPHFDNYPIKIRPVYMVDNAQPHRARDIVKFLQQTTDTLAWI